MLPTTRERRELSLIEEASPSTTKQQQQQQRKGSAGGGSSTGIVPKMLFASRRKSSSRVKEQHDEMDDEFGHSSIPTLMTACNDSSRSVASSVISSIDAADYGAQMRHARVDVDLDAYQDRYRALSHRDDWQQSQHSDQHGRMRSQPPPPLQQTTNHPGHHGIRPPAVPTARQLLLRTSRQQQAKSARLAAAESSGRRSSGQSGGMRISTSSPDLRQMSEYASRDPGFRKRFSDFVRECDDGSGIISIGAKPQPVGTGGPTTARQQQQQQQQQRRSKMSMASVVLKKQRQHDVERGRVTTIKVDDAIVQVSQHHLSHFLQREKRYRWLSSFRRLDPRHQILTFFNDVSREGGENVGRLHKMQSMRTLDPLLRGFVKASAFSVWRPTSSDAILKMMRGEATGKGLDVKGKSAKRGKLSGYIPYVQIHDEEHKRRVRRPPRQGRVRIFYRTESARDKAMKKFDTFATNATRALEKADQVLARGEGAVTDDLWEQAMEFKSMLDVADPATYPLNDYTSESSYGMDVPERYFFELCIKDRDISRPSGSDLDTGRASEPAFQDMNFVCTRSYDGELHKAVVLQMADEDEDPLKPQTLVVAYEEHGRVVPVVSDFDCFTVGTRGVAFGDPLPSDQVGLMVNMIDEIENILDGPESSDSWTARWLAVLKKKAGKADDGKKQSLPQYGYGDPKSYDMMQAVARRLEDKNGAVRHGAECFNLCFPQEIDDHFLVVCDSLPGRPWKYVGVEELQEILCRRIDEGFTFPLNPKWILCDPGWKRVYDKLIASTDEATQKSLDMWYPPDSGIRERIEEICTRHPDGFQKSERDDASHSSATGRRLEGTEAMDLAEQELKYHLILKRAKLKLRVALLFGRLRAASSSLEDHTDKQTTSDACSSNTGRPTISAVVSLVAGGWQGNELSFD